MNAICDTTAKSETLSVKGCKVKITYAPADTDCLDAIQKLLQHPQDTPHARIYDRLTSMCAPVRFTGSNFRKETAQEKLERLKQLMKQRKEGL